MAVLYTRPAAHCKREGGLKERRAFDRNFIEI
jgi:hypothetical protein